VLTMIQQLCSMKQKKTQIHTNTNKSMHSEMGPVWQNPIQRTVITAHLRVRLCTTSIHNTTQNSSDNLPIVLPPDKHHSSDAVYWRGGGTRVGVTRLLNDPFYSTLCKIPLQFFLLSSGCHPLDDVTRGSPPLP